MISMRGLADIYLDVRGATSSSTYPGRVTLSPITSPRSLVSFSLPTHLLRTTFGPGLRKRNFSPEHGVSRTTRREN